MRRRIFHPSRRVLQTWLQGDVDDPKLDAHVTVCRRCANTLERLDSHEAEAQIDDLAGALALALAPPDDLSTRLEHKVTQRLDSRVMFGVLTDLFAAGVETSRMLILEERVEPGEDDQ